MSDTSVQLIVADGVTNSWKKLEHLKDICYRGLLEQGKSECVVACCTTTCK